MRWNVWQIHVPLTDGPRGHFYYSESSISLISPTEHLPVSMDVPDGHWRRRFVGAFTNTKFVWWRKWVKGLLVYHPVWNIAEVRCTGKWMKRQHVLKRASWTGEPRENGHHWQVAFTTLRLRRTCPHLIRYHSSSSLKMDDNRFLSRQQLTCFSP